MEIEQGDVLLCTVDRISGTTVFVHIEELNKEGSIVLSEIAPGRIRNLRNYVVPKKTIVCKVLKISGENIQLSLRRVNQEEQKKVMEQYKLTRSYSNIFKTILKEKTKEIIEKIKQKQSLYNFVEEIKNDPKGLEILVGKENSKKILEILKIQKQKTAILKKTIELHSTNPKGLELIKKILKNNESEIKYISAGKYSIRVEADNIKKADQKIQEIASKISPLAKENSFEFKLK
jgi:translation initiation factor 2 alpha subunit (eIF-2alpha)